MRKRKASKQHSPPGGRPKGGDEAVVLLPRSLRDDGEDDDDDVERCQGNEVGVDLISAEPREEETGGEQRQGADMREDEGIQVLPEESAGQRSNIPPQGASSFAPASLQLLRILRGRLGRSKPIKLAIAGRDCEDDMELRPKLQQVQHQVEEMIADVVDSGQSNSILLLGDRGSGKTALLERALRRVEARFPCQGAEDPRIGVVRLNGLVTCDDRAVFKELASQLCRLGGAKFAENASYEENLSFLKEALEEIGSRMAVVFVLDELDAFARRTKQVVLYNLFDALQSPSVVACVVGLSCRHDAVELLEKRVQSRFSHRKMLVQQPKAAALSPGREKGAPDAPLQDMLKAMLRAPSWLQETDPAKQFAASVDACISEDGIKEALEDASDMGVSPQWLADVILLALSRVSPASCSLKATHLTQAIKSKLSMERGQADLVSSLSVLQLFLLVGLCRLERKEAERINFQAVFHEYTSLQRACDDDCERFARPSAMRAFEDLVEAGMISFEAEYNSKSRAVPLEYQQVQLLVSSKEVEAGLKAHSSCPCILHQWLLKESVARCSGMEI